MFGSPLFSTLLSALLFGSVSVPLWMLIRDEPPTSEIQEQVITTITEETTPAFLSLRSAHPFRHITLKTNGKTIVDEEINAVEYEIDFETGASLELEFDITWHPETPETALLIIAEPDGQPEQRTTYWGQSRLNRTHQFHWDGLAKDSHD